MAEEIKAAENRVGGIVMANKIYRAAFHRELEYFVSVFSEDGNTFFKRDGRLIHPGEFGRFREEATKKILSMTLKPDVSISDGFLINTYDEVSTQCDIIVHNANSAPIIHDNIVRMFPVEDVRAIFEIKSTLSMPDLEDALIKLSHNKQFRKLSDSDYQHANSLEFGNTRLGTFLICNNFSFNFTLDNVNKIMKKVYADNNIHPEYWHNGILSLQDGILIYSQPEIEFKTAQTIHPVLQQRNDFLKSLVRAQTPINYYWVESNLELCIPNMNASIPKGDLENIKKYFAMVNTFIHVWCKVSAHDPISYLGIDFQKQEEATLNE